MVGEELEGEKRESSSALAFPPFLHDSRCSTRHLSTFSHRAVLSTTRERQTSSSNEQCSNLDSSRRFLTLSHPRGRCRSSLCIYWVSLNGLSLSKT